MGIAAIGNWLFNFAIGLFIPPAFINIKWGLFVVFGVLCILASIQFFFTYPEVRQLHGTRTAQADSLNRLVERLLKRLRSCSAKTDHMHGRLRRVVLTSLTISKTSQPPKPREMPLLLLRTLPRKRRVKPKGLRLFKKSSACSYRPWWK
jgi:hypothetical protein